MKKSTVRPYPDLLTWRTSLKINQHTAAQLLGMTQVRYSRLERRVQMAPGKEAKVIMEKTGVPLEVLVGAA